MFHRKDLHYLVPNGVTTASMGLALFALVKVNAGEYETAGWIIIWCAMLDRLDGVTARWLNASSEFGIQFQFDTLTDLLAFCLVPALLVCFILIPVVTGIIAIDGLGAAHTLPLLLVTAAVAYSILGFVFGTVRKGRDQRWLDPVQIDRTPAQSDTWPSGSQVLATPAPASLEQEEEPHTLEQCQSTQLTSVFRKEGEYWTVVWAKSESKLKHRKGLDYIAYLLRHPGQEFGVVDLISAIQPGGLAKGSTTGDGTYQEHDGIARSLGDAGAILDATAKAQYKRRLQDLREDLESAERDNDLSGADKARTEIEFIEAEVVAAVGLGGRDRKSSSHAERARLAVTKAIKTAISRIREVDSELGKHLSLSIQTGYFCTYVPPQPITWRL